MLIECIRTSYTIQLQLIINQIYDICTFGILVIAFVTNSNVG